MADKFNYTKIMTYKLLMIFTFSGLSGLYSPTVNSQEFYVACTIRGITLGPAGIDIGIGSKVGDINYYFIGEKEISYALGGKELGMSFPIVERATDFIKAAKIYHLKLPNGSSHKSSTEILLNSKGGMVDHSYANDVFSSSKVLDCIKVNHVPEKKKLW